MNSDTVVFFPKQIYFPAVKINDFLTQAAEEIITILVNPQSPTVTSLEYGHETKNALLKLALLFDKIDGTNKKLPCKTNKPPTLHKKSGSTTNCTSDSGITINNSLSKENRKKFTAFQ